MFCDDKASSSADRKAAKDEIESNGFTVFKCCHDKGM